MKQKRFVSFRAKLIYFGATLISIVALPALYFEAQRPWEELYGHIEKARVLIGVVAPTLDREELDQMNHFAIDMTKAIDEPKKKSGPTNHFPDLARSLSFEMIVSEGGLLPEREVLSTFLEHGIAFASYNYSELEKWEVFWLTELDKRPGLMGIFRKYKTILVAVAENADRAGFEVANFYIIVDRGQEESGFFKENVAYVLASHPWWKGAHPGQAYNLTGTNSYYWRESYDQQSGGRPGFFHNPVYDPDRLYRPRFNTDDSGSWFTSWLASPAGSYDGGIVYNTFNIDFDSRKVEALMLSTAFIVAGAVVALFLTLVLVTNRISNKLTEPVTALTKGAEAVMAGDWNHVVPTFGKDEISNFIETFNAMTHKVSETIHLKETLTKFLSAELAEMAAKDGLSLGGRRVRCTILFSDFAGFSTIAQKMAAEDAVQLLNMYFAELIPIIKKWGGFPDKYIGDAIVALFGAPVSYDDHAERAVRCGIEMQQALRNINRKRKKEKKIIFEMRVGINTGDVVVGAIGCDLKMEYTSIGENTNLAHRMESKCKIGHVLMSDNSYEEISEISFMGVHIGRTPIKETVKGYQEPVSTYGIYVHDKVISINMKSEDPAQFYIYETKTRK